MEGGEVSCNDCSSNGFACTLYRTRPTLTLNSDRRAQAAAAASRPGTGTRRRPRGQRHPSLSAERLEERQDVLRMVLQSIAEGIQDALILIPQAPGLGVHRRC